MLSWISICSPCHRAPTAVARFPLARVAVMRVVVIGGTGHIGTYLVPSLVRAGHEVVVISRGSRRAYQDDPVWEQVELVVCDRVAAERDGTFGSLVAAQQPEAVLDLMCFTPAQARQLV